MLLFEQGLTASLPVRHAGRGLTIDKVARFAHVSSRFLPMDYNAAKPTKPCQVKTELALHYEPSTVEWLLTEMTENRNKKIVSHLFGSRDPSWILGLS